MDKDKESKDSKDQKDIHDPADAAVSKPDAAPEHAGEKLSAEGWKQKPADAKAAEPAKETLAEKVEQGKPFAQKDDANLRDKLDKWAGAAGKEGAASLADLKRFSTFFDHINDMIKDKNTLGVKTDAIDKERFARVLSVVEKYQDNQNALNLALKNNDQQKLDSLMKDQAQLKKQMESKEFRTDFEAATKDMNTGFNVLRQNLGTSYDGLLTTLVEFGRKIPLEQLPQDLPQGLKGFAVSNEQFKSLVTQGQLKLPEKTLAAGELPGAKDMAEINKLLIFTDAASQEVHRGMLEQQFAIDKSRLNQIDASGELAKKWFPEKVETLSDEAIEKRLAAAAPWIQKGLEVQRYAELHHRLGKMVNDQFNWPSWMGGIPSKWDSSALESNKDLVSATKDEKTGKVNISVKMPESLERNDENTERMRQLDGWLSKNKGPVDQVLGQIDGAKAENSVIYWGDIKSEMRIDKDGNMVEKGFKDAKGNQVFTESDGRKFRFNGEGAKEWVPPSEKLNEADFRVINGKTVWMQPGEEIKDINLMEFRTEAKEAKNEKGEPIIEIRQKQNLQYAHWASYNGWGWVSDVKTMGGDIKATQIAADTTLPEEQGVAGGRRDGKKGDYLVTLADGRKQFVDEKSFKELYREKAGKPGEFEEQPKKYKPDDWLIVYRTDSGAPQPTLMQAKDVPAFCSSQHKWHWGTKIVTTGVDALMVLGGVAEVRAAMVGVEAAAGTAAKMTTMQVLGKAMLTQQGLTGALHAGFGVTGFMGQGIENLGPYGKTFMQVRAIAMMADLGYTAIGRPGAAKAFVPTAEQIAGQGAFTRGLLNFNRAFSETPMHKVIGLDKAADYLGKFQSLQKIGSYMSPLAVVGRIPGAAKVGGYLAEASFGKIQALGADVFFLSDIGFRQIPGIINRAAGTDGQQNQQRAALDRRWEQASLPENKKTPSSFDKQTMMRIDAFQKETDETMKLPANDPKRIEFNKRLIDTVKNEKADSRDRFAAAFSLVTLNQKPDGKLPEKISARDSSIERASLHKFVDSQRYLQAKEVVDGYNQNLKVHVSPELQAKLDKLTETAKLSMSERQSDAGAAMRELVNTFNSAAASPEEKLVAASAILFARKRGADGQLSETVGVAGSEVKAKDLVDFLYNNAQANQGSGKDVKANPGHTRLLAGDMMLRLDSDRFSLADMSQICLSIVNDKNAPADPVARERFKQLKMQAMVDAHGYRLGDLYETMKSRVEPAIAAMSSSDEKAAAAKRDALASLLGRDSESIKKSLEALRADADPRISGLATYMLYAADSPKPSERTESISQLHKEGGPLAWPQDFKKESQDKWVAQANDALLSKLKAELPGQAGDQYDKVSWDKFRATQQLIAKNQDLKSNPELQAQINAGLMSLISSDNPTLAAQVVPLMMSRMQAYSDIFKQLKPEQMTPALTSLRDGMFGGGAILETLRQNYTDMLSDSATDTSYATRAANLAKDLQSLQNEYASKRDSLKENERAGIEAIIAELTQNYNDTAKAPAELKKSLLRSLPDLVKISAVQMPATADDSIAKSTVDAVRKLISPDSSRPETASPELRAQAATTLATLGDKSPVTSGLLALALKNDASPQVRLAAIDALNNLGAADLQKLCLQVLPSEKHPEVAKRLREVEFSNRRPGRDSQDYEDKFHDAKIDLINSSARSLTGAENYLKADPSLKFLDGGTLRNQAYLDLKDLYFNGVGGFFRFAWEGESGVDADHAKLLDKYAGYMKNSMDALGSKAATEPEALKALVYVALSNGRPLLKDDRGWGAEKATEKLKEICQNASPEKAKEIAWAVQNLLLHQPTMSAQGRQNVLDGLKSLIAKPGQAGLTDTQVSTLLASAMQRELRNTPAAGAKDFAAREKLQLDMLDILSNPKYRNKDILPVLEAIADGSPKFKVVKDSTGAVSKVQYPDGSSRELQKINGVDARYIFTDSQGKQTVWLPDAAKANTWYKETDTEKKEPWVGSNRFDSATGDYISFSAKDGVTRVIQPSGALLDLVDNKISRIQYPNGTSKEFDPPGDQFARYTVKAADGKVTESYVREGNSDTFYSVDDKEKKKPWTGKEMLDPASGDHIIVQGQIRTVKSSNGAIYETKDGVTKELSPPSSTAFNTSINSVRLKAQEMYAQLADRSDTLRQQAQLPEGSTPDQIAKRISDDLSRTSASSERIGRSIALSEKLGAIKDDNDPRRDVLSVAARDGHELVRLMAARELAKSSNAGDRSLAYSVLASLEKQGSRPGYVSEAHELIAQIIADKQVSAEDKAQLDSYRKAEIKLDAATYRSQDRTADTQNNLDYQDAFERATQELKENALRVRSLSKYEGSDNWFSKNDNYKLLDADKLREGIKQAVTDAYPGMIPWLFTSQATIDKKCRDAANDTIRKQGAQLAALGEQAKLTDGKAEREALASIILSQGQPFGERDRRWAMQKASIAIYNCIKDGHPGSRDMLWAVKAALIEEPSLDPVSRSYLIGAVEQAKTKGIMDSKEASIVMAAALQSEYQGMPSEAKDPKGYKDSIENQITAISLISSWGNREASPALEALANYHPDAVVRSMAKSVFNDMNRTTLQLRRDAAVKARDAGDRRVGRSDAEMQAELNKLQAQMLEFERIRLRLPVGATPEQIEKAQKAEAGKK